VCLKQKPQINSKFSDKLIGLGALEQQLVLLAVNKGSTEKGLAMDSNFKIVF
jgi:hypothetical protein